MWWRHLHHQLFKPMSAAFTVAWTLLFGLQLPHPIRYGSVLEPIIQHPSPFKRVSPSHWLYHNYWQTMGNSKPVFLKLNSKGLVFLNIHSILSLSRTVLHPFANSLLLWKVIQKYGYIQGEGVLLESLSSVWEYHCSDSDKVAAILLLQLCSHPQNGTSQLEWTKVHRWVGEGRVWVLTRVEVKTSAQARCTHTAPLNPALSKKQKKKQQKNKQNKNSPSFHSFAWSSLRIHNHPSVQS